MKSAGITKLTSGLDIDISLKLHWDESLLLCYKFSNVIDLKKKNKDGASYIIRYNCTVPIKFSLTLTVWQGKHSKIQIRPNDRI